MIYSDVNDPRFIADCIMKGIREDWFKRQQELEKEVQEMFKQIAEKNDSIAALKILLETK